MTSSFDQLATKTHGDWRALLRTGANCLVTAPLPLLDQFVSASRDVLREPILWLSGIRPLDLKASKTIVVMHIHLLAPTDQQTLVAWIEDPANDGTQVIGLTPVSLFAMVDAGLFAGDLFYRLNAIHLHLGRGEQSGTGSVRAIDRS
jgi:hypothetical protein